MREPKSRRLLAVEDRFGEIRREEGQVQNAADMELQRTPDAKVKLTLEVEAQSAEGFSESDVGVVRDNARQLKFKSESTDFEDR